MNQQGEVVNEFSEGSPGTTIPRCIHQTWKTADLPKGTSDSWRRLNPDWEWRLWTDDDLLQLVREDYPRLEELFLSYPNAVQRADLGRYLILDRHGGIYADIDTECLAPLDILSGETRVVLAEEPVEHLHHAHQVGMYRMYFNGVMAGPRGHPFWKHLIRIVERCRHAAQFVLESTGPMALTGAIEEYDDPAGLAIHSPHIFNPLTDILRETTAPEFGPLAPARLAVHLWHGVWWRTDDRGVQIRKVKRFLRKARYRITRGPYLSRDEVARKVDHSRLRRPVQAEGNVAILIPVRDAARWLDRCMSLLNNLDYPREQLSLTFCEGDSRDDTKERLEDLRSRHAARFREIRVLAFEGGPEISRGRRWDNRLQLARRAHLAGVRNHLINHGIDASDDWALWIDVDVCDYPADILRRLLMEHRKVVTPDCRLEPDGPSYDLNAFNDPAELRDHRYYKYVRQGLYMPPATHPRRRHLHDMRFLQRAPLSSVGGTMLLVDANVHRAGIRFPTVPYDDLLETEGFGRLCRDFGVTPVGLPNVAILHSRD